MSQNNRSENHAKAPVTAAHVKALREVFGDDVKVLRVREEEFHLGDDDTAVYATCFVVEDERRANKR